MASDNKSDDKKHPIIKANLETRSNRERQIKNDLEQLKKRDKLHQEKIKNIRTRSWYTFLKFQASLKLENRNISHYQFRKFMTENGFTSDFARHKNGFNPPGPTTLELVNNMFPGSKDVFNYGPLGLDLWSALTIRKNQGEAILELNDSMARTNIHFPNKLCTLIHNLVIFHTSSSLNNPEYESLREQTYNLFHNTPEGQELRDIYGLSFPIIKTSTSSRCNEPKRKYDNSTDPKFNFLFWRIGHF